MKRKRKQSRIDVLRASGYAFLRKEGNALYYENRYTGAIVRLQNGRMRCVWRGRAFCGVVADSGKAKTKMK